MIVMRGIIYSILLILVLFGVSNLWSADWKYVGDSRYGDKWFFDNDSITYLPNGNIALWLSVLFSEAGKRELILNHQKANKSTDGYNSLEYDVNLFEINCSQNTFKIIHEIDYARNGTILRNERYTPGQWEKFTPHSMVGTLHNIFCTRGRTK